MTVPNTIKLSDLLPLGKPERYKLHLAGRNSEGVHPLNEYINDRKSWLGWNAYRGTRDDWTREYVLSFLEFYPLANAWLFGGAFRVLARNAKQYELEEVDELSKFEGRLVATFYRQQGMRGRAFYLEKYIEKFEVLQLLPERFDGEKFVGYKNLNHRFDLLRSYVLREKQDWKAALSVVKGVYLVMDEATGRPYVGAAYAGAGIWSRLATYVQTGHGWNDELVRTINEKGLDYALANFRFSILEVFTSNTPDDVILDRESHWKKVLLSREHGYNGN